jgi:hypothetical protein
MRRICSGASFSFAPSLTAHGPSLAISWSEVITFPSKCSDGSTAILLALNSYFTIRIFQPSSLHMQLTSSEARMQRLK